MYCPDKYKIHRRCDEAVDNSLAELKLVPDWFVASKMIKILFAALYTNENLLYFNEDSGNVVFSFNEVGVLNIDLNNMNLDNNFDEDDPNSIILVRLLACYIKFEKRKALKELWGRNIPIPLYCILLLALLRQCLL